MVWHTKHEAEVQFKLSSNVFSRNTVCLNTESNLAFSSAAHLNLGLNFGNTRVHITLRIASLIPIHCSLFIDKVVRSFKNSHKNFTTMSRLLEPASSSERVAICTYECL